MRQVIEKGSEPARFAFAGNRVLFSKLGGFKTEVREAVRFTVTDKAERVIRFYAQFEAGHCYYGEALRLNILYLLGTTVSKFILFSGRASSLPTTNCCTHVTNDSCGF